MLVATVPFVISQVVMLKSGDNGNIISIAEKGLARVKSAFLDTTQADLQRALAEAVQHKAQADSLREEALEGVDRRGAMADSFVKTSGSR